jgi:fibronectin-binding autotransporter adhesin
MKTTVLRSSTWLSLVLLVGGVCSSSAGLRIWDGSSSGYWGNGQNWVFGGIGPLAADDLVFAPGPSRVIMTNDLPADFGLNGLLFTGPGYSAFGNAVVLSNGLHASHGAGTTRIAHTVTTGFITASNPAALLVLDGPVRYPSSGLTFNVAGRVEASNTISQVIAGAQHVLKTGTGTLELAASNRFNGTLFVREGTVFANHDAALGIATGQGTIVSEGATLLIGGSLDILESSITVGGTLALNSFGGSGSASKILGAMSFSGTNAAIDVPVTFLEFAGPLSGTNGFRLVRGALVVSSNSPSFSGAAVLASPSRLIVHGQLPLGAVHLDGGWLSSDGRVGSISSLAGGGLISFSGYDTLICSNLAFNAATTCEFRVGKQGVPVSGKLDARGTVSLGSCAMDVNVTVDSLLPGETITLIQNDGTDPVIGTFAGLPEGAQMTKFFTRLAISYMGGDGNDVVLTVLPNTRFWVGGGADDNWQTANNWDGNVRAHIGDNLVFPAGAARLSNIQNIGAGIPFNWITLGGTGYTLLGNRLILNAGLFATYGPGTSTVALPIRLGANQTFYVTNGAVLNLVTNIETDGKELTLDSQGELRVSGLISQAGSLVKSGPGLALLSRSNAYAGATVVAEGTLQMTASAALGSSTTGTVVNAGGILSVNPGLMVAEPLALAGTLKHNSSGVATSLWTGPVTLLGAAAAIEVEPAAPLSITGTIAGTGSLTKQGGGTLLLSGSNTFSGATVLAGGTLIVNGTQPQSPIQFTAGVLGGRGVVGRVSASGAGAKTVNPGGVFGVLTTSNLLLNSFTSIEMDLNGTTPGLNHDQLFVHGSVNLGNCQFVAVAGSNLVVGQVVRIIDNDGADPVVGSFSGVPEGASAVAVNGLHLRVTYRGGDGNDVEITVANAPSSIMRIVRTPENFVEIRGQGRANVFYTLEATTNLASGAWINITEDLADSAGVYELIDVDAASFGRRFYRVLSP